MLHPLWNWLRELKMEAPWYFWAYVALTPLSCLICHQDFTILCFATALAVYIFLLKTFRMLRSPSVYIFAIAAYILTAGYIVKLFLGKSLYLYFNDFYSPYWYPEMYYFGTISACSAPVAGIFALVHRRSFSHALKVCITSFFMLIPSIDGILLILLPFFAC